MSSHVKIYGVTPRIRYTSNGVLNTYEYPFAIFKNSDLKVYFDSTLQNASTYTVSGAGDSDGGSVVLSSVPTSGTIITLTRDLSIERTTDFQEGGALRSDTLNTEFDYQIACQQQIADNLNRSMVLPPYAADTNINLTLPLPSAGKAIVWNSAGTNLENSTVSVNAMESTLNGYKTAAQTAATTATTQAQTATTQAQTATTQATTATEQATIATQKATEVSESLSTKANINMDNISADGKKTIANLGSFSHSSVNYTLPSAGGSLSYTAPANGFFSLRVRTATDGSSVVLSNSVGSRVSCFAPSINVQCGVILPVQKNETVTVYVADYSTNSSNNHLKFFYAQGEV